MSFKVGDNKLLKKYNKIWEKISNLMNIEFDSEPVYGFIFFFMYISLAVLSSDKPANDKYIKKYKKMQK